MRKCLPALALGLALVSQTAVAATWQVATNGNDNNPGTPAQPFLTWQAAIDRAGPGDSILVRPGVYKVAGNRGYGVRISHSGTRQRPITIAGDGGRAVLDCAALTNDYGMNCLDIRASWWRVRDLDVTGVTQPRNQTWSIGIMMTDTSNDILERVASYRNEGAGIMMTGQARNNLLRNCDSHHNFDDKTVPTGGDADGIAIKYLPSNATGNQVVGCRSWSNSDDGFDLWLSDAPITIMDSWSFSNGYVPGTDKPAGDGVGFKLGRNKLGPQHRLMRDLAVDNRYAGFDANGAVGALYLVNNTADGNVLASYSFSEKLPHHLRNNVALGAQNWLEASVDQRANSWNLPGTIGTRDFLSLDPAGMDEARLPDGSLPPLAFLHLSKGSSLIDRGVQVGLPYNGSAPDLGAFESK